jgi:hypothetical protein
MIPVVTAAAPAAPAARSASTARPFADALSAALGTPAAHAPSGGALPRAAPAPAAARPPALLEAVDRARARLDGLLDQARAGRTFSGGELLALQAEAYRTVQTVDLATRLVEQGGQAVKQALATPL